MPKQQIAVRVDEDLLAATLLLKVRPHCVPEILNSHGFESACNVAFYHLLCLCTPGKCVYNGLVLDPNSLLLLVVGVHARTLPEDVRSTQPVWTLQRPTSVAR